VTDFGRREFLKLLGATSTAGALTLWAKLPESKARLAEPADLFDIYDPSSDEEAPFADVFLHATTHAANAVGTRVSFDDMRVFCYSSSSGPAIPAGSLLCSEPLTEDSEYTVAEIGEKSITVRGGKGSHHANKFSEGYLIAMDRRGNGYTYKIASHPAISGRQRATIELFDTPEPHTGKRHQVVLMKNIYQDLLVADGLENIRGLVNMDIPDGRVDTQYFWLQTWGVTRWGKSDPVFLQVAP
jgi:hypothetical protein